MTVDTTLTDRLDALGATLTAITEAVRQGRRELAALRSTTAPPLDVVAIINASPGLSTRALLNVARASGWTGRDATARDLIAAAIDSGDVTTVAGARGSLLHFPPGRPVTSEARRQNPTTAASSDRDAVGTDESATDAPSDLADVTANQAAVGR